MSGSPIALEVFAGDDSIVNAIVESPKGCRYKYKFNEETELMELSSALPEGFAFPFEFGFVPSTRGGDGDPLDLVILMDQATFPGCHVKVRIIGVLEAVQQKKNKPKQRNDRLLGVAVISNLFADIRSVRDLPRKQLREIEGFFEAYGALRGSHFRILAVRGPKHAVKLIRAAAKPR